MLELLECSRAGLGFEWVPEAEILLNEHPYITQDSFGQLVACVRLQSLCEERLPSKDDAVGEALKIFVSCCIPFELVQRR